MVSAEHLGRVELAVNTFATSAVVVGEVPTLRHKLGDDTVELGALRHTRSAPGR